VLTKVPLSFDGVAQHLMLGVTQLVGAGAMFLVIASNTVRARPAGWLSTLSISIHKSVFYGIFVFCMQIAQGA
jgi:hypothetical protein